MDDRYDRFVKPLENEHWGKFVAVSAHGDLVLADSLIDAVDGASTMPEEEGYVYKVGERVVGKIR